MLWGKPDPDSIGALFARLIDSGRSLIVAELSVYRLKIARSLEPAKPAIVLGLTGLLLALASLLLLIAAVAFFLSQWIGPVAAVIVTALLCAIAAWICIRAAATAFSAIAETFVDDPFADEQKPGHEP